MNNSLVQAIPPDKCVFNENFNSFSDQLWRYSISDKKLTNKVWGSQDIEWEIPLEEGEGNLVGLSKRKKVLGLGQKTNCNFGDKTSFQTRGWARRGCNDENKSQVWLRSRMDDKGWFTIENQANGLLLSAVDNTTYIMSGTVTRLYWFTLEFRI